MCDSPSPSHSSSAKDVRGQTKISDYFSLINSALPSKRSRTSFPPVAEASPAKRLKSNAMEGATNQNYPSISLDNVEIKKSDNIVHSGTGESVTDKASPKSAVEKLTLVEKPTSRNSAFDIIGRKVKKNQAKAGTSNERRVGKYTLRSIDKDLDVDAALRAEREEGDTVSHSPGTESDKSVTSEVSAAVDVDKLFLAEKQNTIIRAFDIMGRKVKKNKSKAGATNERRVGKYTLRSIDKDSDVDTALTEEGDTVSHSPSSDSDKSVTSEASAAVDLDKLFLAEKPNTNVTNAGICGGKVNMRKSRAAKKNKKQERKARWCTFVETDSEEEVTPMEQGLHSKKNGRKFGGGDVFPSRNRYDEGHVSPFARHTTSSMNLEFYRNKVRSVPDGDFIEDILSNWKDDFKKLERHHGYIQWLFPLKEIGMNNMAQVLQEDEAKAIRDDAVLKERVLRSYKMMLGFYGLVLTNDVIGLVGPSNLFEKQMAHLNSSFHNNLRITRILKALGEFGFEHLKKPLLVFLIKEAFLNNTLVNCRRSCVSYWIPTLKSKEDQGSLENMVKDFESRDRRKPFKYL